MRSRTVRRPALCWRDTLACPPICRAAALLNRSSSSCFSRGDSIVVGWSGMSAVLRRDDHQDVALGYGISLSHPDIRDSTSARRCTRNLHLHGLQDGQDRVSFHAVALTYFELPDASGHFRQHADVRIVGHVLLLG